MLHIKALRENPPLPLPTLVSLTFQSSLGFLLLLSLLCVSLVRILVIKIKAHPDHLEWLHLKISNLIISSMTLLQNKIPFTGSRG